MSMSPETRRRLDIASAQAWVPTREGQEMSGTIVAIERREIDNQYGKQTYPVLVHETAGGFLAVHALGKVLIGELTKLKPKIGDTLAYRYNGKTKSANGEYANITLIGEADTAVAWSWDEPAF